MRHAQLVGIVLAVAADRILQHPRRRQAAFCNNQLWPAPEGYIRLLTPDVNCEGEYIRSLLSR